MKEYVIKNAHGRYRILWMNRIEDAKLFIPDAVEVYDISTKITHDLEALNA